MIQLLHSLTSHHVLYFRYHLGYGLMLKASLGTMGAVVEAVLVAVRLFWAGDATEPHMKF